VVEESHLATEVCAAIRQSAFGKKRVVLMIDDTESCQDDLFQWFGESILLTLGESADISAQVILAGQGARAATWPAELRGRRGFSLAPLDFESTEELIGQLPHYGAYIEGSKDIYHIANGHPYSTVKLVEWLGNHETRQPSAEYKRMAEELLQNVIDQHILFGVDESTRKLIQLACVPRRFNAGILQSLALRFCPELVAGKEIQWYSNLLIQLREAPTCAVLLGAHTPAYELEPTLRRLLHTALAILNPVEIKTIHNSVIDLIAKEITQTSTISMPSADRTLEIIYHRAQVAKLNGGSGSQSLPEALDEILKAYYSNRSLKRITELYTLSDRLGQDVELAEVIGLDTLTQLTGLISSTIKPEPASSQAEAAIQLEIDYRPPDQYIIRWNRPGQTLLPTQIAASGRRFALDDWRASPETIGRIAFRLFLPQDAQEFLRTDTDWYLQLTTSAPDVPWELLHDGKEFLSLKWPVARRANLLKEPKHPSNKNEGSLRALVIGNPTDNLPGAAEEARRITGQLQEYGIEVDLYVGSAEIDALKFVSHLIERQYDLIHYAGHAYFDPQDPRRSGLLFSDGPFFAEELERAMESSAFVFLSACEASATMTQPTIQGYRGNMVDGLAISVLHTGCIGLLGPMWPINDVYAIEFASAFYHFLFATDGVTFSRAVQQARRKLKADFDDYWAAWVLYGDVLATPAARSMETPDVIKKREIDERVRLLKNRLYELDRCIELQQRDKFVDSARNLYSDLSKYFGLMVADVNNIQLSSIRTSGYEFEWVVGFAERPASWKLNVPERIPIIFPFANTFSPQHAKALPRVLALAGAENQFAILLTREVLGQVNQGRGAEQVFITWQELEQMWQGSLVDELQLAIGRLPLNLVNPYSTKLDFIQIARRG
jgi:hypothetical protein